MSGAKPPRTAEFIDRAIQLSKDGYSRSQVARIMGVSQNVIVGVIHRHGGDLVTPATRRPRRWDAARVAKLRELHATHDRRQIAEHFGVSRGLIAKAIKKHAPDLIGHSPFDKKRKNVVVKKNRPNYSPNKPPALRSVPTVIRQDEPTPTMVPLVDLTNHTCRWPVTGEKAATMFCGDWADETVYCPGHAMRARGARP